MKSFLYLSFSHFLWLNKMNPTVQVLERLLRSQLNSRNYKDASEIEMSRRKIETKHCNSSE